MFSKAQKFKMKYSVKKSNLSIKNASLLTVVYCWIAQRDQRYDIDQCKKDSNVMSIDGLKKITNMISIDKKII